MFDLSNFLCWKVLGGHDNIDIHIANNSKTNVGHKPKSGICFQIERHFDNLKVFGCELVNLLESDRSRRVYGNFHENFAKCSWYQRINSLG